MTQFDLAEEFVRDVDAAVDEVAGYLSGEELDDFVEVFLATEVLKELAERMRNRLWLAQIEAGRRS